MIILTPFCASERILRGGCRAGMQWNDNLESKKSWKIPVDWIWDENFKAYKRPDAPSCSEDGFRMFFRTDTKTFFCCVCKEEMTEAEWDAEQMKGYL